MRKGWEPLASRNMFWLIVVIKNFLFVFSKSTQTTLIVCTHPSATCRKRLLLFGPLRWTDDPLEQKPKTTSAKMWLAFFSLRLSVIKHTHTHGLIEALCEHTGSLQVQHGLWGPVPPLKGTLGWRNNEKEKNTGLVLRFGFVASSSDLSDKRVAETPPHLGGAAGLRDQRRQKCECERVR